MSWRFLSSRAKQQPLHLCNVWRERENVVKTAAVEDLYLQCHGKCHYHCLNGKRMDCQENKATKRWWGMTCCFLRMQVTEQKSTVAVRRSDPGLSLKNKRALWRQLRLESEDHTQVKNRRARCCSKLANVWTTSHTPMHLTASCATPQFSIAVGLGLSNFTDNVSQVRTCWDM